MNSIIENQKDFEFVMTAAQEIQRDSFMASFERDLLLDAPLNVIVRLENDSIGHFSNSI